MKKFKKIFLIVFLLFVLFIFASCSKETNDNIIILYTSDVHGAYNENIGFDAIKKYKESCLEETKYVSLVDVGDFIDGTSFDIYSKGDDLVKMRNQMGYDILTFGNHEFSFGITQLKKLMDLSTTKYTVCNIEYKGKGENIFKDVSPYEIIEYGDIKIAYIGVITPLTYSSMKSSTFYEDGERVYYFTEGDDGKALFNKVQDTINTVRSVEKADYVILLSHLGDIEQLKPYTSINLANNTYGVDAIFDGHAHSKFASKCVENKNGENVVISAVGTKLESLGRLDISKNGDLTFSLLELENISNSEDSISNETVKYYQEFLNQKAFTLDFDLKITDDNGIRMIRSRELAIGDFVADAIRSIGETDIAIINGGAIRNNLLNGDIAISDVINVCPFENYVVTALISGQDILDALEVSYHNVQSEYTKDGGAYGESGGFFQVSGLKFEIDTSIPSGVIVDESGMVTGIEGERRVKNLQVLEDGIYVDIDLNKKYLIASSEFILLSKGDGNTSFDNVTIIYESDMLINEAVIQYAKDILNYDLSRYQNVDNRITIR